ncbi:MAG: hypothetical protein ACI8PW_000006 [Methylophilaceae bacterium]|jgi:hypothetical protein
MRMKPTVTGLFASLLLLSQAQAFSAECISKSSKQHPTRTLHF